MLDVATKKLAASEDTVVTLKLDLDKAHAAMAIAPAEIASAEKPTANENAELTAKFEEERLKVLYDCLIYLIFLS